jgi:hypothetical protein
MRADFPGMRWFATAFGRVNSNTQTNFAFARIVRHGFFRTLRTERGSVRGQRQAAAAMTRDDVSRGESGGKPARFENSLGCAGAFRDGSIETMGKQTDREARRRSRAPSRPHSPQRREARFLSECGGSPPLLKRKHDWGTHQRRLAAAHCARNAANEMFFLCGVLGTTEGKVDLR